MNPDVIHALPTINALLNATSAVLLYLGYKAVKAGRPDRHKRLMLAAVAVSVLFLASYLVYHGAVGSVPYPRRDWTKGVYLAILFPHMILAGGMMPFVVAAVWLGLKGRFRAHVRITKRLWPVWILVSVSGVAVYLLLYQFAGGKPL